MRLVSLKLKNYRQYKDSMIEFGDGLTGIIGLNGSGKSTIVEAIAWTLYGNNAARTGKEGIKRTNAAQSASVETELIMEIGGTEYKIIRVLKGASQTGDASIFAGGRPIADSIKGVDKEVNHLLGMDWKSFYTSFFAKQKELNALTDLTPTARRDTIIRMLRIDAVDKIVDSIKKKIRENKLELDILKKGLKDTNVLLSEKLVIEKNKKESEKELKIVETEIAKLDTERSKFKEKFNEERAISDRFNLLDKKRSASEAKLTELIKREVELQEELAQIKKIEKDAAILEKQYNEYLEVEKKLNKLSIAKESELRSIDSHLEELRTKYTELQENKKKLKPGMPCPTCNQEIKDKKYIEEHFDLEMERIKEEGKKLKAKKEALQNDKKIEGHDLKLDVEEYSQLSNKLDALEPSHRKFPMIKAKLDKKADTENSLARITKERTDLDADLKALLKDLKAVPYDEKRHEKITEGYDQADKSLARQYDIRNDVKLEIERLATQAKDKQKEIDDAEKAAKDIKEKTLSHESQEHFINIVTDYRQYLISRIRPKLSEITGNLLTDLTEGKYTGVELDEEYNIWIFDGNIKYPIQRFSGGEADVANLCLRLAISQMIAESSGIETGFLILDEIFGSQDAHRKGSIIEALNRLSKQFRQIIIITHIEDIKDTLENLIEVTEDEEGASYIK
jgi:DNA repair protein SbcC/Rad50